MDETKVGTLAWRDLTVPDAEPIRDFYKRVVGWEAQGVDMKGYEDFNMIAPGTGETVAGICHARGDNAGLPPQWLMYVVVENLDRSAARCAEMGGEVIDGPRSLGEGRFCVIRDPVGAVCALYQP
jgi:predicted enzyme related to lactoylglutathione lyase